jgi:hypothetical protein
VIVKGRVLKLCLLFFRNRRYVSETTGKTGLLKSLDGQFFIRYRTKIQNGKTLVGKLKGKRI